MKSVFSRFAAFFFLITMFAACTAPETPQETAAAFWEAVIRDNARGAVYYSTLEDVRDYDAFGLRWKGLKPAWGRVVIDGDEASVAAEFSGPAQERRHVVTYLVRRDGSWKVDYDRTATGLRGGAFAVLLGELGKLGRELSTHLAASSENLRLEMEAMGQRMNALSDEINQEASERIERHGRTLRRSIDELAASAREALKEYETRLSEEDRRLLDDVAGDLEEESNRLSEPNATAMAESSRHAAKAQERLISINEKVLEQYKRQWIAWQRRFEKEAQRFLDELDAALDAEENRTK